MIALGGNSLSRNGQTGTIQQQFEYTRDALNGISHFIEQDYNICINHGVVQTNRETLWCDQAIL